MAEGLGLEVHLLGPVEIIDRTGPVALAEMPRRLLAVLALRARETVSSDSLIDALWGEKPPASAPKLLHVYVSRLRKELRSADAVVTRPAGYAFGLDAAAIDTRRFEDLLAQGQETLRGGNAALAASQLGRALGLWRGPALGEFAFDDFARAEAHRLEELRIVALEERLEADLRAGRHRQVLPELQSLAETHPLRERLQGQLMVALYRSDRQADALDHFAAVRTRFDEELGLEPGPELRELQRRILQQDAALAAAPASVARLDELPASPNPLLGREVELADLAELLGREDVRLVVLTGPGGCGKTRLALEVARRVAPGFANGVAFVELAPVRDGALVPAAVARVLTLEESPDHDSLRLLEQALRPQELLLALDNAEHLPEAFTSFSRLLATAPHLKLLVTSRAVLHLSGEHVYPVPTLATEAGTELFVQRSRQHDRRFEPSADDIRAIHEICERVDGLPLAIELAAAHTATLGSERLLAALDTRLPLLTGGPRDLPARQQTLRATVDWSFQRLTTEQRTLAARLAVFVASFDLDAAAAVCDADSDGLDALVGQSLLTRPAAGRFAYLETIREFAVELLDGLPDAPEIHRRHLQHSLALAESANVSAVRRGGERLDVVAAAQDNLRGALAWAVDSGSVELGLELACAMERFWVTYDPSEGMRWFAALLARPEAAGIPKPLRANSLRAYGGATDIAGNDAVAEALYRESLTLFEELGDEQGQAVLAHRLGISALRHGDLETARTLVERSNTAHEHAGNHWGQAQAVGTLGAVARDAGDHANAYRLIEASSRMARDVGVHWWEGGMLAELANLALAAGRLDDAEANAMESLKLAQRAGDRSGRLFGVGLLARVAAERGDTERAATLWSAVRDQDGIAPLGGWRRHRDAYADRMTSLLENAETRPAIPLDEAVALALEGVRGAHRRAAG